jgi:hypothetical protein
VIYVGAGTDLLALNASDGSLEWDYGTGGTLYSSPTYFGDDDVIGVGSDDGVFYLIHEDGSLDWTFTVGAPIQSSPAPSPFGDIYVADLDGTLWAMGPGNTVAVGEPGHWPQAGPRLMAAPNPFRQTVSFSAQGDVPAGKALQLFDVQGRAVARVEPSGAGQYVWDGHDQAGRALPSGVYLYRLDGASASGRVVLLR